MLGYEIGTGPMKSITNDAFPSVAIMVCTRVNELFYEGMKAQQVLLSLPASNFLICLNAVVLETSIHDLEGDDAANKTPYE
jgi:hypothetical protein